MARFTKSPMLLALSAKSEAHAQHYLKECQGIELQKVQVLIPTTNILNLHCKDELLELHHQITEKKYFSRKAYI